MDAEQRTIMHLDLDAFFCSVEVLNNQELRGKPLVIGGSSDRGVVASASYEARKYGVRAAMPMRLARQLCPEAQVLSGDMEKYTYYSDLVTEIIAERAPLYEKASIDEFYLDLTGMDKYIGNLKWSSELKTRIVQETGLSLTYALSVNKLVSKMASNEVKPQGVEWVAAGRVKGYLEPLNVQKIPGVGSQTYQQLASLGVRTIRVLRQIPLKLLEKEFGGGLGRTLHEKSFGRDPQPVVPYRAQKSLSHEHTLHEDTTDLSVLMTLLTGLTEQLGFQLRSDKKVTSCIAVKIRYSDFNTVSRQRKISYTSHDPALLAVARELLLELYDRRQRIRLVGVRFSHLAYGDHQINLFSDAGKIIDLHQAMDTVRAKYGRRAVMRGASYQDRCS